MSKLVPILTLANLANPGDGMLCRSLLMIPPRVSGRIVGVAHDVLEEDVDAVRYVASG